MSQSETRLCDAEGLEALLTTLADRIAAGRRPETPLRLVGIRTRGVPIARRLAGKLHEQLGGEVPVGAVDITLYRDDLAQTNHWPLLRGTEIPFPVEGAEIVLVDDVLFTGRTVRAALNAICDLGRPACVRLAVLVDRGGREFPIRADYAGLEIVTASNERVVVRISPVDPIEEIARVPTGAPR
ncbi:MAG: bifunctional pyr operon transcriptional regulator/uracil phosphoribosyltransferase PyrR [Isosphaeraceae bacterium]|nr:bifunctional pyr operon transcriptional regulator/uracil phosphoribosyltransferase PyrR [Isosphaeraceae bacterium]